MATPAFQRIKDIAVKTIECGNRLILDMNANLNVPEIFTDRKLTVDIGGNVIMRACQIDFRNSQINLSGAAIITDGGLTITGNLNVTDGLFVGGPASITGPLFTNNITANGDVTITNGVVEIFGPVGIDGNLYVNGQSFFAAPISSNSSITVDGDAFFHSDVTIDGNLTVNNDIVGGNITAGNLILDALYVHLIFGNSPILVKDLAIFEQGILVNGGNIVTANGNVIVDGGDLIVTSNAFIDTLHVHTIFGNSPVIFESPILLDGQDLILQNGGSIIYNNGNTTQTITYPLPEEVGGTHQSTYTMGDTLYASAGNTLSKLTIGSTGDLMAVSSGGIPSWIPTGHFAIIQLVFNSSLVAIDASSNMTVMGQSWISFGGASPGGYWNITQDGFYTFRVHTQNVSAATYIQYLEWGQVSSNQMSPFSILINPDGVGTYWGSFYRNTSDVVVGGQTRASAITGATVTIIVEIYKIF